MEWKAPSSPNLHRPLTPGDFAVPSGTLADEPADQAAALAGIKDRDKLAEAAGIDPKVLAETEEKEWHDSRK